MTVKDKAAAFLTEYKNELSLLQERIITAEKRIEDISLEIKYLEEKEIPEAVQKRVLSGNRTQEAKVRKQLDKLKCEKEELHEDLIVLKRVIQNFHQQKAAEVGKLKGLFQEELRLISQARFDRLMKARKAYQQALKTETDVLHIYQKLEAGLQNIEVAGGRKSYVETTFSLHPLKMRELAISSQEVTRIAKRLE
ncbi:hypothetical protein V1502_08120 [Bacillus sp. SCS-153A]|uniref:hypothetical protein n=1 Tax=Rossellomorea sedimentorum TaxID=3115294 RepID=UPI003905B4C8